MLLLGWLARISRCDRVAIAAAVREAIACRESGESKTILTALCGHGHLDLASYDKFMHGEMEDLDLPQEVIDAAMRDVPVID